MIYNEYSIGTEILRQYFINHPQSIDKYTFLQNSAFTHWVKEKSKEEQKIVALATARKSMRVADHSEGF
ncbi:hypothetical protein AGR56_15245 [Clostridium sp. DMHC 10]|nr:hypothetical protein AGR56_15245 [Clostridium sp. DMHC 10]